MRPGMDTGFSDFPGERSGTHRVFLTAAFVVYLEAIAYAAVHPVKL